MKNDRLLEQTFQKYLDSNLDPEIGKQLCSILPNFGLENEARSLQLYLESGNEVVGKIEGGIWSDRRYFVGPYPPVNCQPGDLWFDVIELTLMVLIPHQSDPEMLEPNNNVLPAWVSTHPVYVWQFRAFLNLVKIGSKIIQIDSPSDYLLPHRFNSQKATDFVTNLYHDEAIAYATWFGKGMGGQFELQGARDFLFPEAFSQVLPAKMRLWDGMESPVSEFVRIAIGGNTIDKNDYEEAELRDSGENESLPDRMLFEEWDAGENIGFCTTVNLALGLIDDSPKSTIFFDLLNRAYRDRKSRVLSQVLS